jgi:hypothetical protein
MCGCFFMQHGYICVYEVCFGVMSFILFSGNAGDGY